MGVELTEKKDIVEKYKGAIVGAIATAVIGFGASWVQLNGRMSILETKIERQDELRQEIKELSSGVSNLQRKVDVLIFRGSAEMEQQ